MEQPFKFSIQNLLSKKENGHISAPMSPMLFAREMAKQSDFKFNRLARVWFEDERIHQCREDGGNTGHDTLLIGAQYENDFWLSLWVDSGIGGIPVAMCYQSDGEITTTPIYTKTSFARKLTTRQIAEIFNHVFSHPEIIAVKKQNRIENLKISTR